MSKALMIDLTKCFACHTCVLACKDEHVDNDWLPIARSQPDESSDWIRVDEIEKGTAPKLKIAHLVQLCMQCDDAPCIKAATGGAVYRRADGIVIIDPVKSAGQKQLVGSCPYGLIYWNEQLNIPQKCTLCAHLLDQGRKQPRCVNACPTEAITFGEYEDLKPTIEAAGAAPLRPELGTKPRVYYVGLPTVFGMFITGALVNSTTGECLKEADVTCKDSSGKTFNAKSDAFGDFWFEGLDAKKTYDITISAAGKSKNISVSLDKDTDLGDIQL
jgi:tetrathionate reductase subunit B